MISFTKKASNKMSKKHVVKNGESIKNIAKKYGMTEKQIRQLNNLNQKSKVQAGQVLLIATKY